jgi:predicted transcriptional regulator
MTAPVLAVAPDTAIEEVARVMQAHQVNRVPVIDEGRLVGIVTRGDVLGAVAHLAHALSDAALPPVVVGSGGMNPGGRTCNR